MRDASLADGVQHRSGGRGLETEGDECRGEPARAREIAAGLERDEQRQRDQPESRHQRIQRVA